MSGSHGYRELCLDEEKRLAELAKRRQYSKPPRQSQSTPTNNQTQGDPSPQERTVPSRIRVPQPETNRNRRCYACNQLGYFSRNGGQRAPDPPRQRPVTTKQVSARQEPNQPPPLNPELFSCLLPSDSEEEGEVRLVTVGGEQRYADVLMEGVPASRVINSGAEISIINGKLFRKIAAVARLKRSQLKPPDRIPKTYDRKVFQLDGRLDLDICFDGLTMRTPVYVKLDAADQLLLGEGVCRQLRIITYHPSVTGKKSRLIKSDHTTTPTACAGQRDLDSTSREPTQQRSNKEQVILEYSATDEHRVGQVPEQRYRIPHGPQSPLLRMDGPYPVARAPGLGRGRRSSRAPRLLRTKVDHPRAE